MVDQLHPASAPSDTPTPVPAARAALAGLVAAMAALAAGELASSVAPAEQSLVASVGTAFIDRFAGSLKDLAVAIFGTNDKAALLAGIVVIAAGAGAALGSATRHRPWIGPAGFAAFGALGLVASAVDPQANPAIAVAAAAVATAAGSAVLWALLRVAVTGSLRLPAPAGTPEPSGGDPGVTEHPTDPLATRRAFFGWVGAVGGLAAVTAGAARALAGRSPAETVRADLRLPPVAAPLPDVPAVEAPLGVPGLSPYYVPDGDFYLIDTALVKPQVDPAGWRLRITGLVDRPYELGFDELLALPQVEEAVTLSCVSNEVGGNLVGNARWQGVHLADLLDRAGVQAGATQIVGVSVDGFTAAFPTEVGLDGRVAMVAVGMNGEPLPVAHGFPARLVVAGLYGYVSATKWLSEIRLVDDSFLGFWIDKGWAKEAPVKTQSRIDVPRARSTLAAGPAKVAGVAWAPDTGITGVEVQIDAGPWQPARLAEVVSKNTWVQWVLDWDAPTGDHELACRATDASGSTQTSQRSLPAPDGATGWHRISVTVR